MNRIYNFFTHWIVLLSLLEKYTKINVYPSIVLCFIGSTILGLLYKISINNLIILGILHILPFFWTKVNFKKKTLINNLYIGIAYLLFIFIQGKEIGEIYKKQYLFYKKNPTIFKSYVRTGNLNMCLFC